MKSYTHLWPSTFTALSTVYRSATYWGRSQRWLNIQHEDRPPLLQQFSTVCWNITRRLYLPGLRIEASLPWLHGTDEMHNFGIFTKPAKSQHSTVILLMPWLQLRFDYNPTTTYRTHLLPIRCKQKSEQVIFCRSRIAVESNAYCNFDHFSRSQICRGIVVS